MSNAVWETFEIECNTQLEPSPLTLYSPISNNVWETVAVERSTQLQQPPKLPCGFLSRRHLKLSTVGAPNNIPNYYAYY